MCVFVFVCANLYVYVFWSIYVYIYMYLCTVHTYICIDIIYIYIYIPKTKNLGYPFEFVWEMPLCSCTGKAFHPRRSQGKRWLVSMSIGKWSWPSTMERCPACDHQKRNHRQTSIDISNHQWFRGSQISLWLRSTLLYFQYPARWGWSEDRVPRKYNGWSSFFLLELPCGVNPPFSDTPKWSCFISPICTQSGVLPNPLGNLPQLYTSGSRPVKKTLFSRRISATSRISSNSGGGAAAA